MDLLMSWILWLEFTLVWVMRTTQIASTGTGPYLGDQKLLEMGGKPHKVTSQICQDSWPHMSLRTRPDDHSRVFLIMARSCPRKYMIIIL
ncbi:hypothetical protein CUMW_136600 [Citrus unshiu]|uniref:Secreted protein n=1 Tax=Citrus unshiu TaxID=55188 RepID=A0A2H5PI12_CITUN|nr:hypothetical protein CUMW_136600 [Citrus unshiu]